MLSSEAFKKKLVLVAIDEAHCISEWCVRVITFFLVRAGQDFRKSFRMIGGYKPSHPLHSWSYLLQHTPLLK